MDEEDMKQILLRVSVLLENIDYRLDAIIQRLEVAKAK